jgi:hypothetical protein
MDITNIEPVERNACAGGGTFGGFRLSILLGFGELCDDGDA